MTRRWVKWMPAAAMPALVAGVVIAGPLQAESTVTLPEKTPEQLIAMVAASNVSGFSGTVEQRVDLGLPELPSSGHAESSETAGGMAQVVEALSQDHTARVYADGAAKQRVQLLDVLSERDIIRNGSTVWTYDSTANKATKTTLPAHQGSGAETPAGPVTTPADLAAKLLAAADPSTNVAMGTPISIANRAAYVLTLTPRTAETLVDQVSVAVDAQTGVPLSVAVRAKGSTSAAFEVAFTQLTLEAPPASVFAFTPPAGATVTEQTIPSPETAEHQDHAKEQGRQQLSTTGTGWATIAATPANTVPAGALDDPGVKALLHQVDGGQALETTLFSVLVTPDGRVFSGAVPVSALQAAAAGR